jgi:hypothetical protein
MMTANEILDEIYKLPTAKQTEIKKNLLKTQKPKESMWEQLLNEGVITHLPNSAIEEDDFEPIKIEGEPLSETIIRERR